MNQGRKGNGTKGIQSYKQNNKENRWKKDFGKV